jgi:ribosomal protein S18 acetylase RimI-like enzyme
VLFWGTTPRLPAGKAGPDPPPGPALTAFSAHTLAIWGERKGIKLARQAPEVPGCPGQTVGVAPQVRSRGYGRMLYEEFIAIARADGRSVVSAITAPVNAGSAAFHAAMGFSVTGPVADYNGPSRDMLVFERTL